MDGIHGDGGLGQHRIGAEVFAGGVQHIADAIGHDAFLALGDREALPDAPLQQGRGKSMKLINAQRLCGLRLPGQGGQCHHHQGQQEGE